VITEERIENYLEQFGPEGVKCRQNTKSKTLMSKYCDLHMVLPAVEGYTPKVLQGTDLTHWCRDCKASVHHIWCSHMMLVRHHLGEIDLNKDLSEIQAVKRARGRASKPTPARQKQPLSPAKQARNNKAAKQAQNKNQMPEEQEEEANNPAAKKPKGQEEEDNMYQLEGIIGRRTTSGEGKKCAVVQYYCKWVGFEGQDSWENFSTLKKTHHAECIEADITYDATKVWKITEQSMSPALDEEVIAAEEQELDEPVVLMCYACLEQVIDFWECPVCVCGVICLHCQARQRKETRLHKCGLCKHKDAHFVSYTVCKPKPKPLLLKSNLSKPLSASPSIRKPLLATPHIRKPKPKSLW
jgi:hypothetical protein